jgi:hypothetical protein
MKWVMIDATINLRSPEFFWRKRGGRIRHWGVLAGDFSARFMPLYVALIDGMKTDALRADKGYNANYIVEAAQNMGAIAVIPPKSNLNYSARI